MSKKRLYKKNIKTKKIKGGVDSPLLDLAKQAETTVANTTSGLIDPFTNQVEGIGSALGDASKMIPSALGDAFKLDASKLVPSALGDASKMIPGVAALGKLGDAYSNLKENIKKLKVPLTEEDKFNHALLKLRTHPQFSAYFTSTINTVLVSEFYKILTQLGDYSKNYSHAVKKVAEKTGLKIVDEDDDFYSDIYSDSSVSRLELPKCEEKEPEKPEVFDNINIDRIIKKKNINNFLEDAMIINVPVIEEVFGKLNKIINEYKKLRGQANILIEKAESENDAETYFEDFMHISNKATEQIDAIFYEFDTGKKIGGAKADVRDDFNSSMLYMCNHGKKNFSKLLKLKLSGILNKIIVRLYDIANMKNVIDDEDEIEPKVLETKVEPDIFDIDAYETRISEGETDAENLDIVKFQKIIVKIVKKMFCNILKKNDIDLEPFKKIVIPAFKEKQKEFETLEKILEKDINEKRDLIKEIGKPADAETLEYMNFVEAQMKWTSMNKNEIDEYIKTEDEKEREKVKREKEDKLEAERLKNMPDKVVKVGNTIEIDDPKKQIKIKVGDCIEYKKNKLSPLTTKKTVRSFDKDHNIKYRKGSDIKKVHLSDIWETIKVVECPKKGGNAITRKSSSRVFRKTRRHKRTSR